MSKKLISLLLAVMLTISMVAVAAVSVSAESSDTLTVNATSNFFEDATAYYNAETNQVEVTYALTIDSGKKIENIQYTLEYDSDVFELPGTTVYDEENDEDVYTNYSSDVFNDGVMNFDVPGKFKFNASNIAKGYSTKKGCIAKFIFNVKDGVTLPAETEVNMKLEVMTIANYSGGQVDTSSEEHVAGGKIVGTGNIDSSVVESNGVVGTTTLSESTAEEPVTEPTTEEPATEEPTTEEATTEEPTTEEQPATEDESTDAVVDTMYVSTTSNIAVRATSSLAVETGDKIEVDYYIDPTKDVMATQWILTYDDTKLKLVSCEMPQMTSGAMYNGNVSGEYKGDASDLNLYTMDGTKPFVTAVFEVIADPANGEASTVVDLNVEYLLLADKAADGSVDESSEVYAVTNSVVSADSELGYPYGTVTPVNDEPTTIKPGEEPTTAEPTEEPTTAEPTEEPTTVEPTEEPTTVEPAETTTSYVETTTVTGEEGTTLADATSATGTTGKSSTSDTTAKTTTTTSTSAVQTGEASMAVIILAVLAAATGIVFYIRKKEMF